MTNLKPKKFKVVEDLLNELLCAQYDVIEHYKMNKGSYIHCGRWNEEINDMIKAYNEAAKILGLEKLEMVERD